VSASDRIGRLLGDRRLTLVLRLAAGAVLVYASLATLLDPQPFADAIDDYRILPLGLVNATAIVLPWVELVTGFCLIVGLWTPGAGLMTVAMAAVYTGALTSALLRGLEIGCGCFGDGGGTLSWPDLWLRLALLAAGLQVLATARFLDWPLAALSARASRGRRATGPTPGS
jgi:putative oxidoreductase